MASYWLQWLPPNVRAQLTERQTLQQVVNNFGWLLADRLLRLGLGISVGGWMARYLGPGQFGTLNYVVALASLLSPIATLGLDAIVVRDLKQHPDQTAEILGTTWLIKILGSLGLWLLAYGISHHLHPNDDRLCQLVMIIATSYLFQSTDCIDYWFQSQMQSKYTVMIKNSVFFTMSAVRIILILGQMSLKAFAIAGLFESVLGAIGLVSIYRRTHPDALKWRIDTKWAKQLLSSGWLMMLSSIAIIIYMRIDQMMLHNMLGDDELGFYSAALKLSELWYFIPTAIMSSAFPALLDLKSRDIDQYYQRLKTIFRILVGVAYAIAIPMTFLSGWVIFLLYGPQYSAAAPILATHIWASVFVFLGVAQSSHNVAEGWLIFPLQQTCLGAVINVLLNLILIPHYGGWGAAIATVIAYGIATVPTNFFYQQARPIFRLQLQALLLVV